MIIHHRYANRGALHPGRLIWKYWLNITQGSNHKIWHKTWFILMDTFKSKSCKHMYFRYFPTAFSLPHNSKGHVFFKTTVCALFHNVINFNSSLLHISTIILFIHGKLKIVLHAVSEFTIRQFFIVRYICKDYGGVSFRYTGWYFPRPVSRNIRTTISRLRVCSCSLVYHCGPENQQVRSVHLPRFKDFKRINLPLSGFGS